MRWGDFNDIRGARSLVFYVLLRFTAFYYPFGFFKLLLCSLERISANINDENKLINITSKRGILMHLDGPVDGRLDCQKGIAEIMDRK